MIEDVQVVHAFVSLLALALTAIGTGVSTAGALSANRTRKRAAEMQAQNQSMEAARERTKQVRYGRARRAEILQAGANAGVGDSSSVQAGASGAMAKAYQNIQTINFQEAEGKLNSSFQQDLIDAKGMQELGKGISDLGSVVGQNSKEIGSAFGVPGG